MDCAHVYTDKEGIPDRNHMYANVYKEAVGAKGGNNVASLTLRTLHKTDILLKGRKGGKLSLFDNCVGQNKNNCVIHLSQFHCRGRNLLPDCRAHKEHL